MRLIIFLFLLSSCTDYPDGSKEGGHINSEMIKNHDEIDTMSEKVSTQEPTNQQTFDGCNLQWEQQRVEEMYKNYSKPIEKIDPVPSYEMINALYGQGFQVVNEPIKFTIYIFDHQRQHDDAQKFFTSQKNYDSSKSIMASNGRLFFFGEVTSDKEEAEYMLNELVSVFAGEE